MRKRLLRRLKLVPRVVKPGNGLLEKPSFLPKNTKLKVVAINNVKLKEVTKESKSLDQQKWRTKSGKKSSETGERYLPEKAIKALSSEEYARTSRKKREDTKKESNIQSNQRKLQENKSL